MTFNLEEDTIEHLYKFIALVFIFMIGIAFFSKSIPSISVSTTTASSIQDSTFPMVYLQVGESFINPLARIQQRA